MTFYNIFIVIYQVLTENKQKAAWKNLARASRYEIVTATRLWQVLMKRKNIKQNIKQKFTSVIAGK